MTLSSRFSTRTVTSRNILGAFLGGVLGILACGYFADWALIVGVVCGVIFGFCYDWLWEALIRGQQKAVEQFRQAGDRLSPLFGRSATSGGRAEWTILERVRTVILTVDGLVVGFNIALIIFLGVKIDQWVSHWQLAERHETIADGIGLLFIGAMLLGVVMITIVIIATRHEQAAEKDYGSAIQAWNRSPIGFIASQVGMSLYLYVLFPLVIGVCLLYWSIALLLFASVLVLPVLGVFIGLKLCVAVLRRGDYLLCLIVTLLVTALSAYLNRGWLQSPPLLWTVSLVTGSASALAVYGLRCCVSYLSCHGVKLFLPSLSFEDVLDNWFEPGWDTLKNIWGKCLGDPIERLPLLGRPERC